MFDRGAPCEEYCGRTVAKAARERYGCRSRRGGARLAGSSEKIRPAVAFAESYPIPVSRVVGTLGGCFLRLPFSFKHL